MTRFDTMPAMLHRFDKVARRMALNAKTPAELKRWQKKIAAKLRELTGYDTMRRTSLGAKITEEVPMDGYIRQRVEIHTEPDVVMPMYVLIPQGKGPFPAVMAPHGHAGDGKNGPVGIATSDKVAEVIRTANYKYGPQMAKAGFITFCPDARGFGERREVFHKSADPTESSCREVLHMAIPLGQTVTGMWTWDLHRLADYIQTRRDCIPGQLACVGLSGGGHQAIWAAALDERIRCTISSGYFYGYKESLLELSNNCSCNYVPHLWEHVDMGDIGALIAPRALLIESGTIDPLNGKSGLANVRSQLAIARKAYKLLGASERIQHDVYEGDHQWYGNNAVAWVRRWIGS
jgi:dienelactone hydrolase